MYYIYIIYILTACSCRDFCRSVLHVPSDFLLLLVFLFISASHSLLRFFFCSLLAFVFASHCILYAIFLYKTEGRISKFTNCTFFFCY